jgi:hypothetical protein
MSPEIFDPLPQRPALPFMASVEDAVKLNISREDTFYVSAFMFQCWIGQLLVDNGAQLAEKPARENRCFQNGQAWDGYFKMFGKAPDDEFRQFFGHLMRFTGYSDPLADFVFEATVPLSIEHEITGDFVGTRTSPELRQQPDKLLVLIRSTIVRLCDWLDSILQYRALQNWHLMPDCYDPDPQKREWALLARNQRNFENMDQRAQLHFLNHMSDAVQELKDSPKWAQCRQASKAGQSKPRPWPTHDLDRTIITLWPLLKRYGWSAADLLSVLRNSLSPSALKPCPGEKALASHCSQALGLRGKGLLSRHNAAPDPASLEIAKRILGEEGKGQDLPPNGF